MGFGHGSEVQLLSTREHRDPAELGRPHVMQRLSGQGEGAWLVHVEESSVRLSCEFTSNSSSVATLLQPGLK